MEDFFEELPGFFRNYISIGKDNSIFELEYITKFCYTSIFIL